MMSKVFSTQEELEKIASILTGYLQLPFSGNSIPGALMENVVAEVRNSSVLNTYDFIDILNQENRVGWQVKATKDKTPVTWKRAKIPNANNLIANSKKSADGLQELGDSIIEFCNDHAIDSMDHYGLEEIGYSRLIVHSNGNITYFEKILCTRDNPDIFNKSEFIWKWSIPKITKKKEQLPALHGLHVPSNTKWFAWHGLGENQLHFSGEKAWWPTTSNKIDFRFPENRLSQRRFMELLNNISIND